MRSVLIFFILLSAAHVVYSQNTGKTVIFKDTNYVYTDTINNKVYFGQISPSGLIKVDNGIIVSTEFSIYFPEFGNTAKLNVDGQEFFQDQQAYYSKMHVSSGSIFKLDKRLKKVWEITFKDKRVTQIQNYDSLCFIAAGGRVDQKNVWVAKISSINGKVLWFREFAAKRDPDIVGLSISVNKDIIVLTESRRLIPINIKKHYGKIQLSLFKAPQESTKSKLLITSISGDGNINWKRSLGIKKKYEVWNEEINADNDINVLSSYHYVNKHLGKYKSYDGDLNCVYDIKGIRLSRKQIDFPGLYVSNIDGWVYAQRRNDTIHLDKYDGKWSKTLAVDIKTPKHYTELKSIVLIGANYYLYGHTDVHDILICKLDKSFRLLHSWTYTTHESLADLMLTTSPDGHLIIAGKCYIMQDVANSAKEYINLIEFE